MNKGLFTHLIVTIIYCLLAMYVVQGEELDSLGRFMLVMLFLLSQAIAGMISDLNDFYKQKL